MPCVATLLKPWAQRSLEASITLLGVQEGSAEGGFPLNPVVFTRAACARPVKGRQSIWTATVHDVLKDFSTVGSDAI